MADSIGNLFSNIPDDLPLELFHTLHEQPGVKIERILSNGHTTPDGEWYDQNRDEWVLIIQGGGRLQLEDLSVIQLSAGDYYFIPKYMKHRVVFTQDHTIWLAIYIGQNSNDC